MVGRFLWGWMLAATLVAQVPRRLVVASNIDNRPFEYVDANGKPAGYTNDLFRAVAEAQGLRYEIRPMVFSDMMRAFEQGEVDALTSVVSTPEREQRMDLTAPNSYVTYTILVRKGESRIRTERDFQGRELLILARSFLADRMTTQGVGFREMPTYEACIQSLSAGTGDATIVPKFTWLQYARTHEIRNLQVVPGELYPAKRCMAVHRGDRELLSKLNEGLFLLKQSGKMDEIYYRHLGSLEEGELPLSMVLRRAFKAGLPFVLGLGLVGVLLWSLSLRRLVRLRTRDLQEELAERRRVEVQREYLLAVVAEKNQDLEEKNAALEVLIEDKNQFMGIAAHDIKNPLSAILLAAQQIVEDKDDPEDVCRSGRMIEKAARQMSEIVSTFLNLNQLESGELRLNEEAVHVGSLLGEVRLTFLDQARAKGLDIEVEFPEGPCRVLADPLCLHNVLDNFVSNAIKFMPPGPPVKRVRLRARPLDGALAIEVQDEGPGFSQEDKKRAFGRFARLSARPTCGEGSTGLGLSIVKRLVEAMHGQVELESEPGQGALFRIRLPDAGVEVGT